MKRIVASFALLLAVALPALAQSPDEAAVLKAYEALSKAIVAVDKAALEKLTVPELSYGHSAGRIENQAQFIDQLVSKRSVITSVDNTKMVVSIVGDLAVVRGHSSLMVASANPPAKSELELLMVWQKRGGEWRLLARQGYKV
ncbi:hypothetical protein DSM104443_02909 [Usitatibacter rugosus]|uniref:DUF4440 domain-containing protein n=1 Tax=Usitatibacter rugosus TaxID=2732067 RepID=A0A6M4GX38_9PROT|nr:nuclear transport factor 2 family protein [Usitatibacter rugosus]QJR11826.1 hypothetical protein DSM104443_02909 [Usitatibacter rugosus]